MKERKTDRWGIKTETMKMKHKQAVRHIDRLWSWNRQTVRQRQWDQKTVRHKDSRTTQLGMKSRLCKSVYWSPCLVWSDTVCWGWGRSADMMLISEASRPGSRCGVDYGFSHCGKWVEMLNGVKHETVVNVVCEIMCGEINFFWSWGSWPDV